MGPLLTKSGTPNSLEVTILKEEKVLRGAHAQKKNLNLGSLENS